MNQKEMIKKIVFFSNRTRCPFCFGKKFSYIFTNQKIFKSIIGKFNGQKPVYYKVCTKFVDDRLIIRVNKASTTTNGTFFTKICSDCGYISQNVSPNSLTSGYG